MSSPQTFVYEKPRKLNLGCGYDRRPGYINVDMHAIVVPDVIGNLLNLSQLPTAAFEEIIAQDVLEHMRWRDTPQALFEWNRLLEIGGRMFIRVPSILHLARFFADPSRQAIAAQKVLLCNLFSQQLLDGDYHLTTFTERTLRYYLWECGFNIDEIYVRDEWMFELWATKTTEFYRSDELSPELNDEEFVRRVYSFLLRREPEPEGLRSHLERLKNGQVTRDKVIKACLLSEERENKMMELCPDFNLIFDKIG